MSNREALNVSPENQSDKNNDTQEFNFASKETLYDLGLDQRTGINVPAPEGLTAKKGTDATEALRVAKARLESAKEKAKSTKGGRFEGEKLEDR